MKCPACDGVLSPHDTAGVEVDACPSCGGVWLDKGEFDALLRAEGQARAGAGGEVDVTPVAPMRSGAPGGLGPVTYRRCPRCDGWMARRNHKKVSGVVVDTCPVHGLWLDHQEYERLRAFEQGDGDERSARFEADEARHIANVREQARRLASKTPGYRGLRNATWLDVGADLLR